LLTWAGLSLQVGRRAGPAAVGRAVSRRVPEGSGAPELPIGSFVSLGVAL